MVQLENRDLVVAWDHCGSKGVTTGMKRIAFGSQIDGSEGNDILTGSISDDLIIGDAGSDILLGIEGSDTLRGEAGNDSLTGGTGDDYIEIGRASCRERV